MLPAMLLAWVFWCWVPHSPRWLVAQDQHECGREVLVRMQVDEAANLEMAEIAERVAFEKAVATAIWANMFKVPVLQVGMLGMVSNSSNRLQAPNRFSITPNTLRARRHYQPTQVQPYNRWC